MLLAPDPGEPRASCSDVPEYERLPQQVLAAFAKKLCQLRETSRLKDKRVSGGTLVARKRTARRYVAAHRFGTAELAILRKANPEAFINRAFADYCAARAKAKTARLSDKALRSVIRKPPQRF